MNELTSQATQLPDNLEDLTQFVLVGKATLQAYMLKLQTVNRLSVAQEIREQTFKEAQDMSNALIAAEQRIGQLLLQIPKQSGGVNQYNKEEKPTRVGKSKSETIADMGYSEDEALDYQQMAKYPEVVQKVIADALENGERKDTKWQQYCICATGKDRTARWPAVIRPAVSAGIHSTSSTRGTFQRKNFLR